MATATDISKIDALRWVPASFDPFQGCIPSEGFQGNDYALSLTQHEFDAFGSTHRTLGGEHLSNTARRWPNTWCVTHPLATFA